MSALLAACTRTPSNIAESAIDRFHSQLAAEKYHDIYNEADEELRNSISEVEFTTKLRTVRNPFNTAQQNNFFAGLSGWQLNSRLPEESVRTIKFIEVGGKTLNEDFSWRVKDGKATLVRYTVYAVGISRH